MTPVHAARSPLCVAALTLAVWGTTVGAAPAQPASPRPTPPPPAAVTSEPGVTTASYGDWMLRCQRLAGGDVPRLCEISQSMQVQGQAAPIAQLAIGHLPGQDGLRVTVLLPTNVGFPSTVRVGEAKVPGKRGDGKEADKGGQNGQGLDLAWRRCIPGGCLADAAASEAVLKGWRAAEEPGRISFRDADGRELGIPLSFRGIGPALDALAKERS